MFKKIVVGIDGSKKSEYAMRLACDLAQKYGSEIRLVHTPQPKTVSYALGAVAGYEGVTAMPAADEVDEASQKVLAAGVAIADEMGLSIAETLSKMGDPADNIVACAKGCGADLIVTGRRGLGAVGSLIQGSTTQRVNHLAECACLSVA